jgi:hypothetical protein
LLKYCEEEDLWLVFQNRKGLTSQNDFRRTKSKTILTKEEYFSTMMAS